MRFLGNKLSKRDDSPFITPEPEGPDEISERTERLKGGSAGAAKRKLLEKSGLEEFSPARRFLIASVVAAEAGMMGLNFFTDVDLPAEWLLGLAVPLLALLAHRDRKNKPTDKHPSHPG